MPYTKLSVDRTRHNYRDILNAVVLETAELVNRFPQVAMYRVIFSQLKDIQENVLPAETCLTEDEIYRRYDFGSMAAKNFDLREDEYAQKLSDAFGGLFDYATMPE